VRGITDIADGSGVVSGVGGIACAWAWIALAHAAAEDKAGSLPGPTWFFL
jgi:hypothetical protein